MRLLELIGIPKLREYVKDWRFWLLLWLVNISGNMGFTYYISEPLSVIIIFVISFSYMILTGQFKGRLVIYSLSIWGILFIQSLYVEYYSVTTTLHYVLNIGIAVSIVVVLKEKILTYLPAIIYIYCLISLVCFGYNLMGGIVPYVQIEDSTIDGGVIMRVYNPFYTQLATVGNVSLSKFRNCGPFWEPGAFQGYVNLAFFLDMCSGNTVGNKKRYLIYIISIISTLSTGGYIALMVNLLYYTLYCNKTVPKVIIYTLFPLLIGLAYYLYVTLPFLGEKIASNEDRLQFSLDSFHGAYLLFGYGYDTESFMTSSMHSASSIYSLFRYVGIIGFFVFIVFLIRNNCPHRLFYATLLFVILMNEPFMQYGLWWAAPLFIFFSKYRHSSKVKWKESI